jgi:crossover junction endodeoxyribonuclease RusA
VIVDLPWPPAILSPNSRGHWAKLAKEKKAYRRDCAILAIAAGARFRKWPDNLALRITFRPPTSSRYDLDNALARIKSGLDGIADAIGVDDSGWSIAIAKGERGEHGGFVRVEVVE